MSRRARKPAINLAAIQDPATRQALQGIVEQLEVGAGTRPKSSLRDQWVAFGDLLDTGILKLASGLGLGVEYASPGDLDFTPPTAPTNFKAVGAMATVILSWDQAAYGNHSHTEIWRSALDANNDPIDDVGQATLIGTSGSSVHKDNIGGGGRYYYWARFVSTAKVKGPFNAVAGTLGETAYDPGYALDLLTIKWEAATDYAVGDYVIPTPANETGVWFKCISAGTSGGAEPSWPDTVGQTVADNTVTWEAVAAGQRDKILYIGEVAGSPAVAIAGDLYADGTIVGRMVKAGEIAAEHISVVDLAAISANLGSITGGSLNINNKFIVDENGNVTIISASTGARLFMANNVIKVFDGTNTFPRVKIGDLSA